MKRNRPLIFLLLLVLAACQNNRRTVPASVPPPVVVPTEKSEPVRIMSFNIQIFGVSKMSKPEVAGILADIVSTADIIAIQEVRSAAIDPVEQFMALLPERYRYIIGPRQGRSVSKEQYLIIYDAAKFTVNETETWNDGEDIFERSPFVVYFQSSGKFDFFLINNHIQPSAAAKEINALPAIVEHYKNSRNERDFLIVGDFNADGQYYDEGDLENIFGADEYSIIITGEHDTTVAQSNNTYDRFIITSSAAEDYTGNHGIVRFDDLYDFSESDIQPKNVSDHYPVWAEFRLDKDTD